MLHHVIIQCACLLVVILFVVMLGQKIKIAYPILLVLVGLPLGFVPFLKGIEIQPDLIFVIFLPPLLYESAWNTSWKDFWKWRRVISSEIGEQRRKPASVFVAHSEPAASARASDRNILSSVGSEK